MKYFSSTALPTIFFLLSVFVFAQNPSATPPDDILKISTTLIQVDVTVTDKKGNIVKDLKPEDFEVYENGKKQEISNFSFVSVESNNAPTEKAKLPKATKDSIPIPPVKLKPEQVRRTYALVIDDLGLSFATTLWVKESLRKFVNEQMQEGDLVAILRTGSGMGALQSFTSDKLQLMTAINKIKFNAQSRTGISTFETIRPDFSEVLKPRSELGTDGSGSNTTDSLARELEDFRKENFAVGTLGALNYVIRGMRELPGRKAVMLFSEGFALTERKGTVTRSTRILEAMRIIADIANRSSVLIYTIDPRGLQDPTFANAGDDAGGMLSIFDPRVRAFSESQDSLKYLAYETGGFPFINQNSIDLGIRRVVADQSSYYLLGYQPDDDTFDPKKNKFNKLEIKLKNPDLKVRYRSGFFSVTDEKIQNVAQTPRQKLTTALTSPFGASDIDLSLYPVYQNDAKNGDVVQALVYIDAKDLNFKAANGKQSATFDILAMTFGDNGAEINQLSKTYTLEISDRVYQNLLTNGFVYKLDVPIKKSGAYQFRIALRDTNSNKIGAASQFIEVPNFKKKISLSNLILDSFTPVEWEKVKLGDNQSERSVLLDTTLRQFRRGSILRYDYVIYNPKQITSITTQMRLINNGKVIYEEKPAPIKTAAQTDLMRLQSFGAFDIAKDLKPGTYILQIVVADPTAKGADSFSSQFIEFEVVA